MAYLEKYCNTQFPSSPELHNFSAQCDCGIAEPIPESSQLIHKTMPFNTRQLNEEIKTLYAWLHITDRCNLRCVYCYLPHNSIDMSLETGQRTIDATFHSALLHGFKQVFFKYSGGEPLLCFSIVKELHRYAKERAAFHNLSVDGIILSNGTLIALDIINDIKELNLKLVISLDGTRFYHNKQRSYMDNERGSFDNVAEGIKQAKEYGILPHISITITSQNLVGLPELIVWILEEDLPFKLNFYRGNVDSCNYHKLIPNDEDLIDGMLRVYEVIEQNLPQRNLLSSLIDHGNLSAPHRLPCSVGKNYLVFDSLGKIKKCQMQIGAPLTSTDVFDPLMIVQNNDKGIQNVSVDEKEGCQNCEWRYWCAGGCPLLTFRATGRYNTKSPYCYVYKTLYPSVLQLANLQSLKYPSLY